MQCSNKGMFSGHGRARIKNWYKVKSVCSFGLWGIENVPLDLTVQEVKEPYRASNAREIVDLKDLHFEKSQKGKFSSKSEIGHLANLSQPFLSF